MYNKEQILSIIVDMTGKEKEEELKSMPEGFAKLSDLPNPAIDIKKLLVEKLDSNFTTHNTYFEILDELMFDGEIIDCSPNGNWGRKLGADGNITTSIGKWVQLCD